MAVRFGRRKSPDTQDRDFLMERLLPKAVLPSTKTWGIAAHNLDQGDYGTCVGNGWANFLRCAPLQTNANEAMALTIYDAAILLDEWTDNDNDKARQMGTSVRAGAMAVSNMGRLKSYVWSFTLQPTIEWVLTMGPVVLGTDWYSSMMTPNAEGVVTITRRAHIVGGHCYLLRGANQSTAMAHCTNSWGDDWGKSGDFYIPFRDLEKLILADGECCSAVEQKLSAQTDRE